MGIRELAERDLAITLEAPEGFGWQINVTTPEAVTVGVSGQSVDIAQLIDPDTGAAVSGRSASVSIRISSLISAGVGLPEGIANTTRKPWVIEFLDINGSAHKFKVSQSNPDRTLGVVTCLLESYK